jgi:hypothetical protein
MDHEARRDTLYANLFLEHEGKKGRWDGQLQDKAAVGSGNVSNADCYWLAWGFIVPWRSSPIHGTAGEASLPRIDANQRQKGQWRSERDSWERRAS